jgi:hypothetical protein
VGFIFQIILGSPSGAFYLNGTVLNDGTATLNSDIVCLEATFESEGPF